MNHIFWIAIQTHVTRKIDHPINKAILIMTIIPWDKQSSHTLCYPDISLTSSACLESVNQTLPC